MQKTSRLNRLLAVLVAVFMAVCCLPLNAFAEEKTYMVDFVFHVGDSTGGEYLDDWTKTGVKVEAYNGIMVSDLLEKASVPMPVGYELANPDEKIDIDADRVVDIEVKKIPEEPSEPEEPAEKPLSRMTVHFVDNNLNDLAESYSLTGGDVALPAADAAAVPEGYTLTGWTLRDYGQNLYAPGTTMTFGELATVVGDGYDKETGEVHLYFYAVLEENVTEPAEKPLSRMTVHFVDNNLNDLAESYSLTGGDVALPAADAAAVPEGYTLTGWTLRDYGQNLYAPGTTMTFGELATVVGDGYDKETGEVYLYFYAVYEGDTQTVGLNFYDEENHEQVCETTVELPADAIHLNTSKIELPEGYEFVETGDLAINDGWIYVGVKPIKTLRIYWAIDNGEAADFADGSADTWTQELSWKHINDEIAMPEITVKDGYVFNGWSVGGQNSEFWGPELATMTVGDKFVADEKGGVISITANIVAKTEDKGDTGATGGDSGSDSSNKNNNTTTATATSANGGEEVVKADTPADPTVKVLPQTGVRVETPVVFGGMLFAALAGAGAYLFAMRKKLNETF